MAALEGCVRLWRSLCLHGSSRRHLAALLAGIALGGSIIKELWPLPDSYLNNKRNVLNVYFVKFSWAWTFWLLLPFIALTNYALTQSVRSVLQRLSSLVVGTVIWYLCTRFFMYVEHITGNCYESEVLAELRSHHKDRHECKVNGGYWHGFDISGHSFLLPFCILTILEETSVLLDKRLERHQLGTAINALFLALGVLSIIWVWMFCCTAIYFHDVWQKMIGTSFGILGWHVTYQWWYLQPFSPGLPPGRTSKDLKPHSCNN
ncbi:acyl-coenzyme A diphosphatase FITM2 [Pelobates fuscus]|uniref:acyl-coenzyme A diphosphatase FITM2 n=1 Tax=Pelobates fuscus TaxID=191477 RepID=UPI002FE46E0E